MKSLLNRNVIGRKPTARFEIEIKTFTVQFNSGITPTSK